MNHGVDTSFIVTAEVKSHPGHLAARKLLDRVLSAGDSLALAPQVLAEFVHVTTDPRRFTRPLTSEQAWSRAEQWWTAREVTPVFPGDATVPIFFAWLRERALGRKRLLDTMLAATYFTNELRSILSTNARDFRVFGHFDVLEP